MKMTRKQFGRDFTMILAIMALCGVIAGTIFLSIEHNTMASPCAGMQQATCPLMQHGDIWNFAVLAPTNAAIIFHQGADAHALLMVALAAVLFVRRSPHGVLEHIRKRLAFLILYNRYLQALFTGILHSKIFA